MPDTHLVMPRTLSAPYAELLETETPQTMTASDAPPNGTAAAATAFARLLASGDHAMQPDSSPITEIPAASAAACNAARRHYDLRAMLLGSTTLPALGMTIAEASQKTVDLLAENDGPGPLTDDQTDALAAQWTVLENAVIGSKPHTILDAASILDRIFPDDATHIPQRDIPAMRRVAAFLHHLAEAARSASPDETSIIPSIGMTFWQATDRVREMVERANNRPRGEDDGIEDKAELKRREAARDADCKEWSRILDAIMFTPAQTVGDLFAKVERLACPSLGIRQTEYLDAEVLVLQEDVVRLQSLWSWIAPSTAGEGHPDADILALGRRRLELIQRIDQPDQSDNESAPLIIEWKEVDRLIMDLEPKTGAGLAVQLAVVWRQLELEPSEEDGPTADSTLDRVWLWTAMKNAERLGRQDKDEMPQDTIASLYARWVEVRARYLDEGLSEEDHDAAEAELDKIEDRLGLEPVRHIGDAIVKLGYFLTHSNQMLDDEHLPAIDANSSYPWPRILFLIEESADRFPADIREPFRAMVAGLRQLMQRHVKLAEETEKRAEAYQLPQEVSRTMQAALERVRAVNVTKRGSGTGGETAVEREFVARARAIDPERRKAIFGLMDFIVVSAHLDDAMRMYAQEHGLAPQYREWLERNHADLAREQVDIKTNDQYAKADDAFADTVAAFEAEAPATLALPQEPTSRMVDAGANAACITPAQFQTAYAAAVEALKLERAA